MASADRLEPRHPARIRLQSRSNSPRATCPNAFQPLVRTCRGPMQGSTLRCCGVSGSAVRKQTMSSLTATPEHPIQPGGRCPVCKEARLRPAFSFSRGLVVDCPACGVFISLDESVAPEQDAQFHNSLDEARYVDYFAPFRKAQYREALLRMATRPDMTLLAVGASYGWMLE